MKESLFNVSRKGKTMLAEAKKECTKVTEEWWAWYRQSFRFGASEDCLQLQSYTILIGVIADSFLTGW